MVKLISSIIILLYGASVLASSDNQRQYATGWHFYQEQEKKQVKPKQQAKYPDVLTIDESTMPNPDVETNPLVWAEKTRKKGEWLKSRALMLPNEQNTMAYIRYQEKIASRADNFASIWPHVMRKNPELDFAVDNPAAQNARHVFLDEQGKKDKQNIKHLSERYGLFFFFKSNCAYCHLQAPIITSVAEEYGLALIAVSADGKNIPGLNPDIVKPDNGISRELKIYSYPAIVAVDHQTREAIPIHTGLVSRSDLIKTISEVVAYEKI